MKNAARPVAGVIPAHTGQFEVAEHPPPRPQLIDGTGQIGSGGLLEVGDMLGSVTEQFEDLLVRVGDRSTRHKISSSRWR